MTKTATPPQRDKADAELRQARDDLDALRARIAAGEDITPDQLADAEQRAHLAEMRLDAADEHERRSAEQQRADAARAVVDQLTDGDIGDDLARALELQQQIRDAATELAEIGERYNAELSAGMAELSRLAKRGPLPSGIDVDRIHKRITASGGRRFDGGRVAEELVAEVLADVFPLRDNERRRLFIGRPPRRSEQLAKSIASTRSTDQAD